MSYNYFVEFTIWSKFENEEEICHLHQKTIESWKPDIPDLEENWKFEGRFFAISIVYRGILSRGYEIINYAQNKDYPYQLVLTDTYGIDERQFFEVQIEDNKNLFHGSFISLSNVYTDQFPNIKTIPLLLIENGKNLTLKILKDLKKKDEKWYNVKNLSTNYATSVFESEPSHLNFWRVNSEKVCLPTTKENKGYNTILECVMDNSKNILKNKKVYVETTSDQIYDIYQKKNDNSSNSKIWILEILIVILIFLIVILLSFHIYSKL